MRGHALNKRPPVAYVVSGMYGDIKDLGAGNAILIIMQRVAAQRKVAQHTAKGIFEVFAGERGFGWSVSQYGAFNENSAVTKFRYRAKVVR